MDIHDKIEIYLDGLMSDEEKMNFEQEIDADPLLKELVDLDREIIKQIKYTSFVEEQLQQAKSELNDMGDNEDEIDDSLNLSAELDAQIIKEIQYQSEVSNQIDAAKQEMKKGKTRSLFFYTSAVAAVLVLGLIVPSVMQSYKYGNIFDENIDKYEMTFKHSDINLRGSQDNEKLFEEALIAIDDDRIDEAIEILESLYELPVNYIYHNDVRWYLSLCYLKNKNKSESIRILKELSVMESKYKTASKAILEEIE